MAFCSVRIIRTVANTTDGKKPPVTLKYFIIYLFEFQKAIYCIWKWVILADGKKAKQWFEKLFVEQVFIQILV